MRLRFTKMQGAGNDFVVIDATAAPLELTPEQCRFLGDRRFGVGADQILVVERPQAEGVDFRYRIYKNSREEVEHCGNGARCFFHFVRQRGLTDRSVVRVETMNSRLELRTQPDGRVTVDMNRPVFDHAAIPFDASGLDPQVLGDFERWSLEVGGQQMTVAVLSMGNPHAVLRVDDVDLAPVSTLGPLLQQHARFPRRVNVGFLQVIDRASVRLRVYERGAGETLACGTGACAAVVAGIRLGWLDARVDVETRGGELTIEWAGGTTHAFLTGPAETVFEGEIEL